MRGMSGNEEQKRNAACSENSRRRIHSGRKNGRGAYLCFSRKCLQEAIKNKGLERSFKQAIPKEVYENLEKELEQLEHE